MLHYRCKYAAHLVPDSCTFLAPFFCDVYWIHLTVSFTYAVLSVYLCCTISIPMLDLWYQNALLFWYRFFNLFTSNIKAN